MQKITTKATAKVAAVATGLAMATSMLSLAPMAHAAALTASQVQSILSLLTSFGADSATIANVQASLTGGTPTGGSTGGSTSSCSVGTADMTVGSSGSAVTCLQQGLIANGYGIAAGATGYFGAQTQSAVMAWQKAVGISPAAGYFGSVSRSRWNLSTGTTGGTTTGGTTTGGTTTGGTTTTTSGSLSGSGRLTHLSSLGDVKTDLKEGDASTAVIGVSADATGGDVELQRVTVTMTVGNSGSQSSSLSQYVSDVSLWLGSTKLASMDPANGDKDGRVWTYRFTGMSGAVIKSGATGNIYVKVTPLTSIGTNEDGKTVTAGIATDSIRAIGGDGISDTYGVSTTNAYTVSSATAGTLTVSEAGDNPKASLVAVSSSTTTGVKLLSFNMKAKNQDVTITDLVASFGTTDNNLNDVVNTVYLMKGSSVLKSKTLSTGTYGTVTFQDVNQTITKDSTVGYSIIADLKGDSAYADGVTLTASTTVSGWDVSDATGASVTPSAAVVGNAQTLSGIGISVTAGSITAVASNGCGGTSGCAEVGTFTIPFTVTAGDNDIYVDGTTGAGKIAFATTSTSGSGVTTSQTTNLTAAGTVTGDSAGVYYKVLANTSRTFTLTVTETAASTGYTGIQLSSINYGTTASMGSSYTSNLDTFKTSDIQIRKY